MGLLQPHQHQICQKKKTPKFWFHFDFFSMNDILTLFSRTLIVRFYENGQWANGRVSAGQKKKIDNVFFRRGAAVATMLLRFPRGASIVVQCRYAGLSHPPPFFSSQHRPLCHSLAKKNEMPTNFQNYLFIFSAKMDYNQN